MTLALGRSKYLAGNPDQDKVTVRANVSAVEEIVNAITACTSVKDVNEHLYRTLQIAVRQMLGRRNLNELLAEKVDIDRTVSAEVHREIGL